MPSKAILAKAIAIKGNPSGYCGITRCGTGLTNTTDCAALLELKAAAPCLAKVAPKDLCGWVPKYESQEIDCSGGRVTYIAVKNCSITSLPTSIGDLTALTGLELSDNGLTSLPASLSKLTRLRTLHLDNNKLAACPSKAILGRAFSGRSYGKITGNP